MNTNPNHCPPGVTERKLGWWIDRGYIKTHRPEGHGPGTARQFTEHERRVLWAMARVVQAGFQPAAAARIARAAVEAAGTGSGAQVKLPGDVVLELTGI